MLNNDLKKILSFSEEKILFVFVGNTLRSDDGVAIYLYNLLANLPDNITLLNVHDKPENIIDPAIKLCPKKTIIFDAANFNGSPGEIKIIPEQEINSIIYSTHTFPIPVLSSIIRNDTGSEIIFVGIQTNNTLCGNTMSEKVKFSAKTIANYIIKEYSNA